ncbi:MAG: hypothetical protein ACRDN6_11995 [Gaiellaceae bacterium]
MARPSLLAAFRRSPSEQPQDAAQPAQHAPKRVAPPASELRRERRLLLHTREDRIRDLGGVVLEMFRRDDFRESLLYDLCAEIAGLEGRLRELDMLLDARRPPAARCECGAPLFWGARFCASCGRSVGTE